MAIELNRHTREPVSPLGGFRGVVPPGEQSTPVTLDKHVTLDYDHADEVVPHHYAFAVSGAEFEAAFGRIRDAGIIHYADPACRQAGQVYSGKGGNRGTYFRDPDGHLMEILTATGGPS